MRTKSDSQKAHKVRLKVPFHDVDPMGIVWHGNYIKYFEVARDELFNSLGVDLPEFSMNSGILFPIVKTSAKYIHPLRYRDEFVCEARIVEAKRKIVVDFEIRLASDGTLCSRGQTEQLAISLPEMKLELNIPEDIQKLLV